MTMQEAFHFPSLVWDWPIAIYLFLLGISAGATTLSVLLRRKGAGSESGIIKATAILAPLSVVLGLLILIFHQDERSKRIHPVHHQMKIPGYPPCFATVNCSLRT